MHRSEFSGMNTSSSVYSGKAVPRDGDLSELDGDSLVESSVSLTEGLRQLVKEKEELKEKLHQLEKSWDPPNVLG